MVAVCQTCGDRGFSVALIYCDKCQAYAVHRYCLYNLPKSFEEYVFWFCVDCEPKVVESSTVQQALPATISQSRPTHISVRKAKGENGVKLKKMKKKKKKKSKYDSDSLALVEVERQSSPLLRPIENPEKDETLRGSLAVCGPISSEEARLIESKSSPLNSCSHSRGSDLINIDDGSGCVNNSMSIVAINEHLNTIEHNFPDPVATNNQMPMHIYVPAQPVFESIWRGSFHTAVENLTIGVVAHLSSLACLKVCETARCLPQLLQIELFPRCDVWPKGFKQAGPSDESIALYFFPINERDANIFYGLMDTMIYQDLSIRVVIQDVELLVYSSNVLPVHSQRFQEKFYLWGVFRAKQPSHLTNGVRGEETSFAKALTCDSRSPVSPLSVNGSHDSMRPVPTQHQSQETCEHCHDSHPGKCWKLTGACLKCGSKDHFVRDCPMMVSVAPETCEHCHGNHPGKCWKLTGACWKCGSKDHFVRDCLMMVSGARTSAQKSTPNASRGRGFGRGSFSRIPTCKHCHAKHRGKCWKRTKACLRCGSKDHFVRDCRKNVSGAPTSAKKHCGSGRVSASGSRD